MDNKDKVIRKLVEFCKKAEGNETTEERRYTITNTAEEIVKLFAIPVVIESSSEKYCKGSMKLGTGCGKCNRCLNSL